MNVINGPERFQVGTIFTGDVNHARFIIKDIFDDIYYHRQGGAAYNRGKKALVYCYDNEKTVTVPISRLTHSLFTIES